MKISLSVFLRLEKLVICLSEEILLVALPRYKYPREMRGIFRGALEDIKKNPQDIVRNSGRKNKLVTKLDIVRKIKEATGNEEEIKCVVVSCVKRMIEGIISDILGKAETVALKNGKEEICMREIYGVVVGSDIYVV